MALKNLTELVEHLRKNINDFGCIRLNNVALCGVAEIELHELKDDGFDDLMIWFKNKHGELITVLDYTDQNIRVGFEMVKVLKWEK